MMTIKRSTTVAIGVVAVLSSTHLVHIGAAFTSLAPERLSRRRTSGNRIVLTRAPLPSVSSSPGVSLLMHNKKSAKSRGSSKGFASSSSRTGTLDQKDRFPYAGTVRPGRQLPQRTVVPGQDQVPSTLLLPDYAETGTPRRKGNSFQIMPWMIEVKTPEEIERMRQSGALARKILDYGGRQVRPGITTDEIDTLVHHAIIEVSVVCRLCHCSHCRC
jgi:hypothetical protein